MRRLVSLVVLLAVAFYVAWPAYSLYRIRGALETRDAATLAGKVDFDSVREGLRPYASAEMTKAIGKVEGAGGVLGQQFKDQLQGKAVDALLNGLVTPENIIKAYAERKSLKDLLSAKTAANDPAVQGAAIEKLSEKTGVDIGKVVGGLFGKKKDAAEAPQPEPAPAPSPVTTVPTETNAKPSYSLQNVKGFGLLGPLGFWVGLARDMAAAGPELIAEMRFTGGDWKVTALKPQV